MSIKFRSERVPLFCGRFEKGRVAVGPVAGFLRWNSSKHPQEGHSPNLLGTMRRRRHEGFAPTFRPVLRPRLYLAVAASTPGELVLRGNPNRRAWRILRIRRIR